MISGNKLWHLFDPKDTPYLNSTDEDTNYPTRFDVDTFRPDLSLWPELRKATIWEANLTKGDILFIPEDWPHQVYNPGPTVALAYNYVDRHNFGKYREYKHAEFKEEQQEIATRVKRYERKRAKVALRLLENKALDAVLDITEFELHREAFALYKLATKPDYIQACLAYPVLLKKCGPVRFKELFGIEELHCDRAESGLTDLAVLKAQGYEADTIAQRLKTVAAGKEKVELQAKLDQQSRDSAKLSPLSRIERASVEAHVREHPILRLHLLSDGYEGDGPDGEDEDDDDDEEEQGGHWDQELYLEWKVLEDPHWPHHVAVHANHSEEHFQDWLRRNSWRLPPWSRKTMKTKMR